MTRQANIKFGEARELRDRGMHASTANADAKSPTWSDRALAFLHEFAVAHKEFPAEHVRIYAHNRGLPVPPDGRAWGTIMRVAAFKKWIRKTGKTTTASDPKVHMNEVRVWESQIYRPAP